MFRNPRRTALLLAAGAAAAGAGGLLDHRNYATAVSVSVSTPLRHLLSTASTGLPSRNPLLAPWQDRRKIIGEEVTKLLVAGFIMEVLHPDWLANPVLVEKKKDENPNIVKVWRMCIDYMHLNKACQKDPFPLPRIDEVIDSTAGCELLSFLDAYSGFHQILLNKEDQIKTSFIHEQSSEVRPRGFPILNSFASASDAPIKARKKGSGGNSDDSRCGRGCLGRDSIANAAAAVGPAVVNISCMHEIHGWALEKSIGSGTIIDPDGTILTCAHVVADFQSTKAVLRGKVSVTLQDGREFEGHVLNADRHSDIAVVKIKSKTPLPAARLGSSCNIRPGEHVVALGCPLSLQKTVTAGIVSCVDRKSSDLGLGGIPREYLQTDCAINRGNSGGPLVNLDGEIIGVNVMKFWAADGLSFAVPIDSVVKIVEHFKRNGRVVRPWLGLKMLDLNPMVIAQLKERSSSFPDVRKGVLVPMVTPGCPAERAGFAPGDVVVEFDGKPVESIKEIIDIMGDKVGVPFEVLVKRANNVSVTLTVIPEEADTSR